MTSWVIKMKQRFERKKVEKYEENKKGLPSKGIVEMRKVFYENKTLESQMKSNIKGGSNLDKTPASVVNQENLCIYSDPESDSLFGSFRKRPKIHSSSAPTEKMSENDIIMRLKDGENEFNKVKRYESILRPPLYQQFVVSKHQNELQNNVNTNLRKGSNVTSLIERYNERSGRPNQENQIDIDLISSLRKNDSSLNTTDQLSIFLQMKENQNIKWSETEQVIAMNLTNNMKNEEIQHQESQFELITSEASYNRSLGVLVDKFYNSPQMSLIPCGNHQPIIKAHQKMHLFSNILKIYDVSCRFLSELEARFIQSPKISNLCDIVTKYAQKDFEVYIPYIQNQKFQSMAYNELKKDPDSARVIEELETQPECCSLSLDSFLLLPMQRLLRILLLLNSIKKHLPDKYKSHIDSTNKAISVIEEIIQKCSDKVDFIEERKRIIEIYNCLVFKAGQKNPKSSLGKLIHEGEVKRSPKNQSRKYFPSFVAFKEYWFILTSEYFLMTKPTKGKEISYHVDEFCARKDVFVEYESMEEKDDVFEFKFSVKKSQNSFDVYIVQTKSKDEGKKWVIALSDT